MIVVLSMLVAFSTPAWATTGSYCDEEEIVEVNSHTTDGWNISRLLADTLGGTHLTIEVSYKGRLNDCHTTDIAMSAINVFDANEGLNMPLDAKEDSVIWEFKQNYPDVNVKHISIQETR